MRRKLSLLLTLFAWLLATGSHWDVVQTVAWGRMFVTYSQSMPLLQAVEKTFSAEGMCGVCLTVADAKQSASANDSSAPDSAGKSSGKILLMLAPVPSILVVAPAPSPWSRSDPLIPTGERVAPPLPPPRAVA